MANEGLFLIQIINIGCSIVGFALFAYSYSYISKILKILENTQIVKRWRFAQLLVGFFSIGYLINIPLVFLVDLNLLLIIQGLVYLFGALFVLLVFATSYKTYRIIYEIAGEE
ncbi:MAG: hypothetical protein ACFFD4_06770 [Candidatus Odinarchaeota archaeon]